MSRLILIHGSGSTGRVWHRQLRHFPDAEAIDLPGHREGRLRNSVEDYAEWLHGYIGGRGYKDVVLAGHSLGGAIVMLYALKYPDALRGLILVSTSARLKVPPLYLAELREAVAGDHEAWEKRLREWLRKLPPEEKELWLKRDAELGPKVYLNDYMACDRFDVTACLRRISTPTLVVAGDQELMPHAADYLAESIPGARKAIIKGATHFPMIEKPEEFNRAVEEFLAQLTGLRTHLESQ